MAWNLNLFLDAKDSFLEGYSHVIAQVTPAPGAPAGSLGTAHTKAGKKIFEDVAQPASKSSKAREIVEAVIRYAGVAKPIIGRPLCLVTQVLIRLIDFFEACLRLRRIVDVRMILTREQPV